MSEKKTVGWPGECSFCQARALSSFASGALCTNHYKTFFRMHDALIKANGLVDAWG